jgi:hypothetical protein
MSTVFSIDSDRHRDRIANIVTQRQKPELQPKQPTRAVRFKAVTACLSLILRSASHSLTGDMLQRYLRTDYHIELTSGELNAVFVVVARYLRKELKEAHRLDTIHRAYALQRLPKARRPPGY